jgi:hypothetical protein
LRPDTPPFIAQEFADVPSEERLTKPLREEAETDVTLSQGREGLVDVTPAVEANSETPMR